MLSFIKSSLKYFIVGILALIPVVIVIQVLVFLETILRDFFVYIYGYSNNIFMTVLAFTLSFMAIAYTGYRVTKSEKLWVLQRVELRRRVTAGLNKGEACNALARAVFFNRLGEIGDRSYEQQRYRASGLTLVTAAIILWNEPLKP